MPDMKIIMPKENYINQQYIPLSSHCNLYINKVALNEFGVLPPSSHAKSMDKPLFLSLGGLSPDGFFSAFKQYDSFCPFSQYKAPQVDSIKPS